MQSRCSPLFIMSEYSKKLANPKWQKKRLEILARDEWKCRICGDNEIELQVHHLQYKGAPHEQENEFLLTLCAECHEETSFVERQIGKINFTALRGLKLRNENSSIILFFLHWDKTMVYSVIVSGERVSVNTLNPDTVSGLKRYFASL